MSHQRMGLLERIAPSQGLRRWTRALQAPGTIPTPQLASMHAQITSVRDRVDRLAGLAETELLTRAAASDGIRRPDQCDWAERAAPWRQKLDLRGHVGFASPLPIGGGVTVFHDAAQTDISLRQDRARPGASGAGYRLVIEVYRFDGSFLSLVQDLPEAAIAGLTLNHFFAVQLGIGLEQPLEVYARLNVQHGPNLEQVVRQVGIENGKGLAEFDLAYTKINEKRVEKAWLDLILEGPEMNRIALEDMVILRAPRADI